MQCEAILFSSETNTLYALDSCHSLSLSSRRIFSYKKYFFYHRIFNAVTLELLEIILNDTFILLVGAHVQVNSNLKECGRRNIWYASPPQIAINLDF